MSCREEKTDKVAESAGIARMLAELIEKNRAQAVELEALGRLVDAQISAAQEREAEQTARLGEVLVELAEAKAAVEIEKQKRIDAEELAAGLITAVDVIQGALAHLPSAGSAALRGTVRDAADNDRVVTAVKGAATLAAVPSTGATPGGEMSDHVPAEDNEHSFALADAERRTVSIVVKLTPAEAVALETLAAQDGCRDGVDAAGHLVRDGLRRMGWKPAADENRSRRE